MTGWKKLWGRCTAVGLATSAALWLAPAALANSTSSVNWAGYAAHRAGVHFRGAVAEWRVPAPTCTPGSPGYSSMWVGLGGFSTRSAALEQTGTEVDCLGSGRARYVAWYELVPAAPHSISIAVRAGDLVRAAVSVSGRRVTIALRNLTLHRTFWKSFAPTQIDTSSAEWIVEAPSSCSSSNQCITLPLADFGQVSFVDTHAVTADGRNGTIASSAWNDTEIALIPGGTRFMVDTTQASGEALPSSLGAGGSGFSVSYQSAPQPTRGPQPPPFFGVRSTRLAR